MREIVRRAAQGIKRQQSHTRGSRYGPLLQLHALPKGMSVCLAARDSSACAHILNKARTLGGAVVLTSGMPDALNDFEADGYISLQKPFKIARLFDAIQTALSQRQHCWLIVSVTLSKT